jgi:ABC-type branched-subunit amino acid transport system permease subunit
MVVGGAAWNGINFAVAIYLMMSIGGVLGLLAAFPAAFRHNKTYAWITSVSASSIAIVALIFACGFMRSRSRGLQNDSPLYIGGIHAPVIVFYGAAFLCCSIEALLYGTKVWNSAESRESQPPEQGQIDA